MHGTVIWQRAKATSKPSKGNSEFNHLCILFRLFGNLTTGGEFSDSFGAVTATVTTV